MTGWAQDDAERQAAGRSRGAPLDLLWEQYRSLGAAQPADFEAFLVAEVERLAQERDEAVTQRDDARGARVNAERERDEARVEVGCKQQDLERSDRDRKHQDGEIARWRGLLPAATRLEDGGWRIPHEAWDVVIQRLPRSAWPSLRAAHAPAALPGEGERGPG